MNCSPLRGIRAEPIVSASPIRCSVDPLAMHSALLDTSLDDEFAAQQQQQQEQQPDDMIERKYEERVDTAASDTLIPTLAELAAESIPSDHDDEDEAPRTPFSLPTPTPFVHAANASTPSFASPSSRMQSAHVTPSFEVYQNASASASASTLVTPPNRVYYNRFATPATAASTPASNFAQQQPLTDYKGTPIDRTMRRNLVSADPATAVDPLHAFRSAAAASLSLTAPRALLNTLASPSKSPHLLGLEAQMARLHANQRVSPFAPALDHDPTPLFDQHAESSLLCEEPSTVELADDAVEEMGKASAADDDDEKVAASDLSDDEDDAAPQARGALLFTPMANPVVSTPFISPASSAMPTPRRDSASQPRIIRDSTPVALAPRSRHSLPSAPSAPLPAPDSQRWSLPIELSKLAEKKHLTTSRYAQGAAAKEEARKTALLNAATSKVPAVAATTAPLPKISPPTLEQWQREVVQPAAAAGGVTSRKQQAKSMAAGLAAIKSKVAQKRQSAAATAASGPKAAPASAPTLRSRPSTTRPSSAATSAATRSRVPLSYLALNVSASGNPWLSAADRTAAAAAEAEKTQQQQQQQFATPIKRMAATVNHTPSMATLAENVDPLQLHSQEDSTPSQQPAVFHLPSPLAPPAQPAQSYRAIVNGVHIIPPSLSWVTAHHTAEPDRIHANLRFITTAYAHAE